MKKSWSGIGKGMLFRTGSLNQADHGIKILRIGLGFQCSSGRPLPKHLQSIPWTTAPLDELLDAQGLPV